jgi:hypothetical protein
VKPGNAVVSEQANENRSTCTSCSEEAPNLRRGWCRPCYLRWFRAGKPDGGPPPLRKQLLDQWRSLPAPKHTREPTDLEVGAAGEHLVCADLLLSGFRAFRSDQSCAYDVAVDLGGRLIRLQVKSTRMPRQTPQRETHQPSYQFHVRRSGRFGRKIYDANAFDLLALVGLDIRQAAYMLPSAAQSTVHIRPPGTDRGKQFADFPFTRALHEIGVQL